MPQVFDSPEAEAAALAKNKPPEVDPSKPVVATLILKSAGLAMQRIRLPKGGGVIDFLYDGKARNHYRRYYDVAQFHREERLLREAKLTAIITTVLGESDVHARALGALKEIIADTSGHRPTKLAKLIELRTILNMEIDRLSDQLAPKEDDKNEPAPPAPSRRETAIAVRRAWMRRAGEEACAARAEALGLSFKRLNNFEGIMDLIIAREFPEGAADAELPDADGELPDTEADPQDGKFTPDKEVINNPPPPAAVVAAPVAGTYAEYQSKTVAQLKEICLPLGCESNSRNDMVKFLVGRAKTK